LKSAAKPSDRFSIARRRLGLLGSILVAITCLLGASATPACAHEGLNSNQHFPTLPPHSTLPSGQECARLILSAPPSAQSAEVRPANALANQNEPTAAALAEFYARPVKGTFVPPADFSRVDGQFSGTTDQILRWGACKWGVDEDVVRAEAVAESHWRQDGTGDRSADMSLCPPGLGFAGAWNGQTCMQSYGILQMKYKSFGGWPLSKNSTAFNVDFRLAYQRACMNGDINYLPSRIPPKGYPIYPHGSVDQMLWGCMGDWFSGSWFDSGALRYIAEVKQDQAARVWEKPGF
jgi:hypothetical protein